MVKRFGVEELIQLTDCTEATLTSEARSMIETALADASAAMNGYIRVRHALPLADVSTMLNRIACVMARFYLYRDCVPENIEKDYDKAIAVLRDVSKGVLLLTETTGAIPEQSEAIVIVGGSDRLFNNNTMEGF